MSIIFFEKMLSIYKSTTYIILKWCLTYFLNFVIVALMELKELSQEDLETLAKNVNRKPYTLYRIGLGLIRPGAALCVAIEQHTGGMIKKADLRPDLFRV